MNHQSQPDARSDPLSSEASEQQYSPVLQAQDAERYRLLAEMAEQSTDMISRHTPGDWRFIYASPAVTHLLGYDVEEIIGLSAYDLYHPDDVADFDNRSPSVSYERGLYTHTYRFRCKNGHYTWLESTSRSLRDPDTGELQEILVVSRDASRRIETEQANQRLARVLERSSDLVIFVDPEKNVTYLNEAARNNLMSDHQTLADISLSQLLSANDYQRLMDEGFTAVHDGLRWHQELEMQGAERKIPVLLELLAHQSLPEKQEYYSLVARDLSEIRAAQAELKRYQAEISHASRLIAMGELASSLAHELNQPLTAIVNYIGGIRRRFSGQAQLSWKDLQFPMEKIDGTAMRAGQLIRSMMDFTRKQEVRKQSLILKDVVQDLMEFCQASADKHHVTLLNEIKDPDWVVMADRIQLEQILLNLVMNGIEACSQLNNTSAQDSVPASYDAPVSDGSDIDHQCIKSEPKAQVVLSAQAAGGVLEISVSDLGPGLPVDNPDQLFEHFFTTKEKGLGMGLAISRSLAEAQGGQLTAENRAERGACFRFSLPLSS
ncbi:PAS domain S-box protein [Oceanospirillum sp. D5]|uniref:histidine kinase n=2 Tax=Oceanospirillum sediminis TaxID=2760088 RepID=A0A839IP06_9GAMM|nr:PAS domain S-box protein [Oceanospirillum sediminis]